jgi:hypothetical protein
MMTTFHNDNLPNDIQLNDTQLNAPKHSVLYNYETQHIDIQTNNIQYKNEMK